MTNLQKKLNDIQIVRALPREMWQRSLQIAGLPDEIIAICLRQKRMTAAQQWLTASERGDLNVRPASQSSRPASARPARPAAPAMRKFGVEIECVGASRSRIIEEAARRHLLVESQSYNHRDVNFTKIVNDGSIRGRDANEVVTPPLNGWDELSAICESIRAAGGRVNKSCGLHVHLDFSEMDAAHAQRIGHNYYMLSPIISNSLAPSRTNNRFCWVRDVPSRQSDNMMLNDLLSYSRYSAVNYAAINRHGTIEFRQHQGTLCFAKIQKWIMFLQSLFEFSRDNEITGDKVTDRADPRVAGLRVDLLRARN